LRCGHARRHRQRSRRGGGGPAARTAGGLRRRLPLLAIQGRGRLPRHPARSVRHAARPLRPCLDRAGVRVRALLEHRLAGVVVMAAIVAVLPLLFPSASYYRVAALVFVFALAAVGLNLLMGLAGQVSLGHAGFMGIGGYAVAIGPTHLGVPSWLSFVIGA